MYLDRIEMHNMNSCRKEWVDKLPFISLLTYKQSPLHFITSYAIHVCIISRKYLLVFKQPMDQRVKIRERLL